MYLFLTTRRIIFYIIFLICVILLQKNLIILIPVLSLYRKPYKQIGYDLFSCLGQKMKHNFHELPTKHSILVLNYPNDIFEYFANGMIPKKTCFVVSKSVKIFMNMIGKGNSSIYVDLSRKKNLKLVQSKVKEKIKSYFILSYVESTKKDKTGFGRIRKGMFVIAKNLNIPITPICIDKLTHTLGIPNEKVFNIIVGKTRHVKNVSQCVEDIESFYRNNLGL